VSERNEGKLAVKVSDEESAERVKPFGLEMKILLTTEDTEGAFSALVCTHGPGEGPPPHFHTNQEEYFYVLEGTYELTINGSTRLAGPGTMVFLPRGEVHSFKNVGDAPARMLDWSIPGGQERYFREIDAMGRGGAGFGPEIMAKVAEANRRHDTHFP
jgi:quercetin dioxygenase-like cupin family protein